MDTRTENAMGQTNDLSQSGSTTGQLAQRGREVANRVSEKWQQTRDRVQEQTRAGVEATDRTVREHPYASIGVAFCAGLLLGVLLSRGRDY